MSRYRDKAKKAIDDYLKNCDKPCVMLFSMSAVADEAAYQAGKKRELFTSLYDYEGVLPHGATLRWVGNDHSSVLMVLNPYHPLSAGILEFRPVAGPFDVAVDMGPGVAPRL